MLVMWQLSRPQKRSKFVKSESKIVVNDFSIFLRYIDRSLCLDMGYHPFMHKAYFSDTTFFLNKSSMITMFSSWENTNRLSGVSRPFLDLKKTCNLKPRKRLRMGVRVGVTELLGIFHEINHPLIGYPHDYGNPHIPLGQLGVAVAQMKTGPSRPLRWAERPWWQPADYRCHRCLWQALGWSTS